MTHLKTLLFSALTFSTFALGEPDPRFTKLNDGAEALASLGGFLDHYVGNCAGGVDGPACQKNVDEFRAASTGKKFSMIVTEDSATMLSLGAIDPKAGTFVLNFTPIFAASNSAVTMGAPGHTDAAGNPMMAMVSIKATIPDGWSPQMLGRQVQGRALRLQVVFTPQGIWSLPKKGGKIIGVKAKFDAVLVTVGRTGDQVALWLGK